MDSRPAAGYFRVSQARDGMKAPEIYEDEIRRFCEYRQLDVGEIFSDIDYSGYNNSENRPALKELVRRRHDFSCVIIPKLSRFGRSLKHLTQLFETFDKDGISLVFLDLGLDTNTSQGRLLRNIMGAFAEYESDVRGDYTRANNRYAVQQGRPSGGMAPYGYVRVNKNYEPHPAQAQVVRLIFERYDEGASQFGIARELAARAIPTPGGNPTWKAGKIARLLDNPAYASLTPLDGELVAGNWEPLVHPEVWQRVAERRKQSRAKWSRPRAPKRLLAGLIYCGDCGRKAYYTARGGGLPGRYRCPRKDPLPICDAGGVNAPRGEKFVTEAFLERARYYLMRGDDRSFIAERQWELATDDERRMLLAAAVERVVILPLEPGQVHPGRGGRAMRVDWKDQLSPVEPPPASKNTRGTGRARVLARDQLKEMETKKAARSERSKAYFRE